MNRIDLLLVQLAEEATEIGKEAAKCLRFGPEEIYPPIGITNAARVKLEINDLMGLIEMLQTEGVLPMPIFDRDLIEAKKLKVEEHLSYSAQCGRLE